jgi:hypothetical protein
VVFSGWRCDMTGFRNSLALLIRIQIIKTSGIAALKLVTMHPSDLRLPDSLHRILVLAAGCRAPTNPGASAVRKPRG